MFYYCKLMSATPVPVELSDADKAILDCLKEGRATIGKIADDTGYSGEHIRNRLHRLRGEGYVEIIHDPTALWELVEDPCRNE